MRAMLKETARRLRNGEDLCMVTVIAHSGSTPRGSGARMLIGKEGRITGTIGGGAVEYRSEHIAADVLKEKNSGEHDFSLTREDVQNLGMICGGAVKVFFQYIPSFDKDMLDLCDKAEELFAAGEDIWLISEISAGGRLGLYAKSCGYFLLDPPDWVSSYLTRHPQRKVLGEDDFYIEQIGSSGKVYVFGCGHVAQELVPVLSHVGFKCVALDDRPEFATKALFPSAEKVILCDFTRLSDFITVTEEDYVCIMTRGHAFDTEVQAQMLRTPACYIGVIGSRNKIAGVRKVLSEQGFADEDFKRITAPIGLPIRAETPAEIAISVAAQMIEVRAGKMAGDK